jgi:uroporphyrinogen decarboxylase
MIDLGVDVVQLDQPRLMGHENLVRVLGGKVCMWNTVDIQWSGAGNVTEQDIRNEVADMVRINDVKKYRGGFIAKHYPSPWDIELSVKRQRLIYRSFMKNGCALP